MTEQKQTFEHTVITAIAAIFEQLFKEVPELRSATVVLDWEGSLNQAMPPGLWFNNNGQIKLGNAAHDEILGSMAQTLRMFETQTGMGVSLIEVLHQAMAQQEGLLAQVKGQLDEQTGRLEALGEETQQQYARHVEGAAGGDPGGNPVRLGDQGAELPPDR